MEFEVYSGKKSEKNITNDYHQVTCKKCKEILEKDIINIPVEKRTQKEHMILMKHFGGVRDYLLSMGEFKEDKKESNFGKVTPIKRFPNKIELVKEVQRMLLMNDYSIPCAKKIGDLIKENIETNKEWYHKDHILKFSDVLKEGSKLPGIKKFIEEGKKRFGLEDKK